MKTIILLIIGLLFASVSLSAQLRSSTSTIGFHGAKETSYLPIYADIRLGFLINVFDKDRRSNTLFNLALGYRFTQHTAFGFTFMNGGYAYKTNSFRVRGNGIQYRFSYDKFMLHAESGLVGSASRLTDRNLIYEYESTVDPYFLAGGSYRVNSFVGFGVAWLYVPEINFKQLRLDDVGELVEIGVSEARIWSFTLTLTISITDGVKNPVQRDY